MMPRARVAYRAQTFSQGDVEMEKKKRLNPEEQQVRNFAVLDAVMGTAKTYREIAEDFGISFGLVSKIAAGNRKSYEQSRRAYCKARGITLEELNDTVGRGRVEANRNKGESNLPKTEVPKTAVEGFVISKSGYVHLTEAQNREVIAKFHHEAMPYCDASYLALSDAFGGVSTTHISVLVRGVSDDSKRLLHEFFHNHRQLPDGNWRVSYKTHFSTETFDKAQSLYGSGDGKNQHKGMSQVTIARNTGIPAWTLNRLFSEDAANVYAISLDKMIADNERSGIIEYFYAMKPEPSRPTTRRSHKRGNYKAKDVPEVDVSEADIATWAKVNDSPAVLVPKENTPRGQVVNGKFSKVSASWHDLKQSFKGFASRSWDRCRIWEMTRSKKYQTGYLAGGEDMLLRLAQAFADKDGGDVSERLAELRDMWRKEVNEHVEQMRKSG